MQTALILSTAMISPLSHVEAEERIKQFLEGYGQIKELIIKYPGLDVFSVDSTLDPSLELDKRLQDTVNNIPNLQEKVYFLDNELGKINKGCGLIVQWRRVLPKILEGNYDYVIHYEPRQYLQDFSFFERFVQKPANYFKSISYRITASTKIWPIRTGLKLIPLYRKSFWTGLFSLETKLFQIFVEQADTNLIIKNKISLEDYMYGKIKKSCITQVDRLGLVWHGSLNQQKLII